MTVYRVCCVLVIAGTVICNPLNDSCSGGNGKGQLVPMFAPCKQRLIENGDLVQTVPVVVQVSSFMQMKCGRMYRFGISSSHRICRVPELTSEKLNGTSTRRALTSEDVSSATGMALSSMRPTFTTLPIVSTSATVTSRSAISSSLEPTEITSTQSTTRQARRTTIFTTQLQSIHQTKSSGAVLTTTNPSTTKSVAYTTDMTTPYEDSQSTNSSTKETINTVDPKQIETTRSENTPTSLPMTSKDGSTVVESLETLPKTTPPTAYSEASSTAALTDASSVNILSTITPSASTSLSPHTSVSTSAQLPTTQSTSADPVTFSFTPKPSSERPATTPTDLASAASATLTPTPKPQSSTHEQTSQPLPTTPTAQPETTAPIGILKVFVTDHAGDKILWADLFGPERMQFSDFLTSDGKPSDITFDSVDQKIYWSDHDSKRIWRADLVTKVKEGATIQNAQDQPLGLAIAEYSRYLYITYESMGWINRVSLGNPESEETLVQGLSKPKALAIDEQNGYLYVSRHEGIDRILIGESIFSFSEIEQVVQLRSFSKMNGLAINSDGTRLFFCDENSKEANYLDIGEGQPVILIEGNKGLVLRDVNRGPDGSLYWLQTGDNRILEMDHYQQSTDYVSLARNTFISPQRMHIARVNI